MVARMGPTGPCGGPGMVTVLVEHLFPSGTPASQQVQQPVMVDREQSEGEGSDDRV